MSTSVAASPASVRAAIDARRPGLKPAKQDALMFFAQGHHLAHFGVPLFSGPIVVTGRGAYVPDADLSGVDLADEGQLNTIGYVVERYGSLAPTDLRTLIKASRPHRTRRHSESVSHIELRAWFSRDDEIDDPDDERPGRAERAQFAQLWKG